MKLSKSNDSKSFWIFFNKCRIKTYIPNTISLDTWYVILCDCFPQIPLPQLGLDRRSYNLLDGYIQMNEIEMALKKCMSNKALGSDLLSNAVYKNIPYN